MISPAFHPSVRRLPVRASVHLSRGGREREGIPYKNDGGPRRTFLGLKTWLWYF